MCGEKDWLNNLLAVTRVETCIDGMRVSGAPNA
jgi:hypothetical protein